jgi:hypothetical protein
MVALKKKKPELRSRADITALTEELEWHDKLSNALDYGAWKVTSATDSHLFSTANFDGDQNTRFMGALETLLADSKRRLRAMGYEVDG